MKWRERHKDPSYRALLAKTRISLDISTAIELQLKKTKMTRVAYARRIGKSKAYVSQILGGKTPVNFTIFTAYDLLDACGLELSVAVFDREDIKR